MDVLQILQKEDIPAVQARLSTIPGKPVIYTLSHRGFKGFRGRSTETALKEINATQVGTMGDAWIDYMGRPKLKAKINVTDPASETNIQTGEVLISDGYWHDPDTPYISSFDLYPAMNSLCRKMRLLFPDNLCCSTIVEFCSVLQVCQDALAIR